MASLLATLEMQLAAAAPPQAAAPAPFLDVFGGLVAKDEPSAGHESQSQPDTPPRTGHEARRAMPPAKLKKTPESEVPILVAPVAPTPEAVPILKLALPPRPVPSMRAAPKAAEPKPLSTATTDPVRKPAKQVEPVPERDPAGTKPQDQPATEPQPIVAPPPQPTEKPHTVPQSSTPHRPDRPVQLKTSAERPLIATDPKPEESPVPQIPSNDGEEPPRPLELAFAAKLVPISDPVAASPKEAPPKAETRPAAKADVVPGDSESETADQPSPLRERPAAPAVTPRARESRQERHPEQQDPAPQREAAPEWRASFSGPMHEAATSRPAIEPEPAPGTPAPHSTAAAESAVPAQPVAPAARDIRIELAGGDRRVEVRLMERAGKVHVAVRTPDAQLAGALRENLPSLSARLEQTGMRTESWHPGADAAADKRPQAAQPSRGDSADARDRESSQSQQRESKDDSQRRSRENGSQAHRRNKGVSFSWFMPSHT
jgi:hypothetical protein